MFRKKNRFQLEPDLERERWRWFVNLVENGDPESTVRRRESRHPIVGEISVSFDEAGQTSTRSLSLLNVSHTGLTVKANEALLIGTKVRVEVELDRKPLVVHGRVVHCTGTLAGTKIGIRLQFSKGDAEAEPETVVARELA